MKRISIFIFSILLSITLPAQSIPPEEKPVQKDDEGKPESKKKNQTGYSFGAFSYIALEYNHFEDRTMVSTIEKAGFPVRDLPNFSFGFGYQYYMGRAILNVGYNLSDNITQGNDYKTSSRYRSFRFSFGYNLTPRSRLSVYPFAGYRNNILKFKYADYTDQVLLFDDYLNQPSVLHELKSQRGNLDIGIGLSVQKISLVNIRAGYLVPFGKYNWYSNHSTAALGNTPNISNQYYISLILGLGAINTGSNRRNENNNRLNGIFASNIQ